MNRVFYKDVLVSFNPAKEFDRVFTPRKKKSKQTLSGLRSACEIFLIKLDKTLLASCDS